MKTKNTLGGIVIIIAAVVFFVAALVCDLLNVPNMNMRWQEIAVSIAMALYGILLLFVRIKGYGWGLLAVFGLVSTIRYVVNFDDVRLLILAGVVSVISIALLIWCNVKKRKQ